MSIEKLYTITEVMAIFNVSRSTIHQWIKKGLIKAITLPSNAKRISESEIMAVITSDSKRS